MIISGVCVCVLGVSICLYLCIVSILYIKKNIIKYKIRQLTSITFVSNWGGRLACKRKAEIQWKWNF